MKNEFKLLRESAYDWDERPHDYFNFTGRVVHKYGLPYIRSKLHFKYNYVVDKNESDANIIGKFVDQVKDEMLMNNAAGANQVQHNAEEKQLLHVVDMEVPASQYDTWINSVPSKYFDEYKQKKHILDQYLSKFNSYERNKVIKIMCENSESKNYVHFLDTDPDSMTTQQFLIYKDVIRFYEQKYLKEAAEESKLWEQFNSRENSLNKINEPEAVAISLNDENATKDIDELKDVLSGEESTSSVEDLKKQLDEMIASTEQMNVESKEEVQEQVVNEEPVRNVRTLDIKPAKTLLFTPQTTVINAAAPFGASKAYEPNYKQTMAQKGINLHNNQIAKVGYATNINDLINERNAKAAANQALVNEIIQNQIAYNSQFGVNMQSSLKTSNTQYGQVASTNQANSMFGTSAKASMMSSNFGSAQQDVGSKPMLAKPAGLKIGGMKMSQSMGGDEQPTPIAKPMGLNMGGMKMSQSMGSNDETAAAKPLLFKKPNTTVARPAQAYQSVTTNTQSPVKVGLGQTQSAVAQTQVRSSAIQYQSQASLNQTNTATVQSQTQSTLNQNKSTLPQYQTSVVGTTNANATTGLRPIQSNVNAYKTTTQASQTVSTTTTSTVKQLNLGLNNANSQANAEPTASVKSSLIRPQTQTTQLNNEPVNVQINKPLNFKPLGDKTSNQDVVGVYKINTKEVASDKEEKKVLVGLGIPTKKLD